jgi:hypothetical protein
VAVEDVCPKAGIPMRTYYGSGWNMAAPCRRRHFGGLWPCPERTVVSPRPPASRQRPRRIRKAHPSQLGRLANPITCPTQRKLARADPANKPCLADTACSPPASLNRKPRNHMSTPFRKSLRFEQA